MPKKPPERLGLVLTRKVGFRNAGRALGVLFAFVVWMRTHDGEAPTSRQLEGETDRSHASWIRDIAAFREAFDDREPEDVARLVLAEGSRRGAKWDRADDMAARAFMWPASVVGL